jgi:hypothetical protein
MDEKVQANYEYLNPRKIPSTCGKWKKKMVKRQTYMVRCLKHC